MNRTTSPGNREAPTSRKSWDYRGGQPETGSSWQLQGGKVWCRHHFFLDRNLLFSLIPWIRPILKILVIQLSFFSDLYRWFFCKAYDPQDGDGALNFSEFLGCKVQVFRVDWVDHLLGISEGWCHRYVDFRGLWITSQAPNDKHVWLAPLKT